MKLSHDSLGFLVSDVSRLMRRSFERHLGSGTLTLAQSRALVHVSRHEGVRQVDLAELLEVQPITLARLLDPLEAAGLIERRADPKDRRAYRVHLTPAAQPHLEAIAQIATKVRRQALRELSRQEATAVVQALHKVRDNLSSRLTAPEPIAGKDHE